MSANHQPSNGIISDSIVAARGQRYVSGLVAANRLTSVSLQPQGSGWEVAVSLEPRPLAAALPHPQGGSWSTAASSRPRHSASVLSLPQGVDCLAGTSSRPESSEVVPSLPQGINCLTATSSRRGPRHHGLVPQPQQRSQCCLRAATALQPPRPGVGPHREYHRGFREATTWQRLCQDLAPSGGPIAASWRRLLRSGLAMALALNGGLNVASWW